MRDNKFLSIILSAILIVSIFLPASALANNEMVQQTYLTDEKLESPITEIESLPILEEDGLVEALNVYPLPMILLVDNIFPKDDEKYAVIYSASPSQLQSKFKHAVDFGISGNYNLITRQQYEVALRNHVNEASTIYLSTYHGDRVFVFMGNGRLVYTDLAGNFISGWKYTSDQYLYHLNNGLKVARQ